MAVILETLSLRQLLAFAVLLLGILVTFFAVGGKIAPAPTTATLHIASICVAPGSYTMDKFYDPATCQRLNNIKEAETLHIRPEHIVFAIKYPHTGLSMSRWFQFLAASIRLEIEYSPEYHYEGDKEAPTFTYDTHMAYRTATNGTWEKYAEAHESRPLVCHFTKSQSGSDDGYYNCEEIPFFEIGSVHYEEYLVNIRIPARKVNEKIGKVTEINFVEIHQNGGFTRMWFTIKSIVGPISVIMLIWFAKRVKGLRRDPVLLEKALFALGVATAFMNFPFEWLTLGLDMPFMLLFSDIRQGLFYCMLMCFWIIFTGEHLVDQPERNRLKTYWRQIAFIGVGCLSLLVFDLCERGYQLHNPFYSIWATKVGSNLAYAFIIFAAVCACLYFLFLCVMIFKVFWNIRGKRAAIPTMSRARQLQYQGLIYRFEFLMVVTVLCAGLTVVFFIISNVNEAHWKFGDEESTVEISSALFIGVYGMWNTYVFSVVFLYAPSRAIPATDNSEEHERLELRSRTEVRLTEGETEESIVYQFTGKTARE